MKVLSHLYRFSGATLAGLSSSLISGSLWGLLITPILMGLSKGLKEYYKNKNSHLPVQDRIPGWIKFLPF